MGPMPSILIIEDDPFNRFTLTAYLEDCGYACLEAGDGLEGLAAFRVGRVDVVVTDLRMPGLDGLGVIAAVKAERPATPVILLTATQDSMDAESARQAGASACLFKPLTRMEALVEAIQAALAP